MQQCLRSSLDYFDTELDNCRSRLLLSDRGKNQLGVEPVQTRGHIRALDGLRGFAVVAVFVDHACTYLRASPNLAWDVLRRVCTAGWFGVDLFFVLSGFLITTILLEARTAENFYKVFYVRRSLRIAPLYYAVLILALSLEPGLPIRHIGQGQIWYWLNLSNLSTAFNIVNLGFLLHFWSLAIEEQFYLVWPTIVRHLNTRKLGWLCSAVIVGVFVLRNLPVVLRANARYPELVYRLTPFRIDTLCGGALLAIVVLKRPEWLQYRWAARIFAIAGFGVFALSGGVYRSVAVIRFGYTGLLLGALGLVALCLLPEEPAARFFRGRLLRTLGRYSFAFYLFHPFAVNFVAGKIGRVLDALNSQGHELVSYNVALLLGEGIAFGVVLGASAASWRFFEEPILRSKRHFRYEPRPEVLLS